MEVVQAVEGLEDECVKGKFRKAVACTQRTIDLYGGGAVALSFNGGKDSTVLLHIIRAACALRAQANNGTATTENSHGAGPSEVGGMRTFVFRRQDDFEEILSFTRQMDGQYQLHMDWLSGEFKHGLARYVEEKGIRAIILGTRRGDPNAEGQETFCPSSFGWPPFLRVNPILDWTYADVWALLRAAHLPYCRLYDQGYTSVGAVGNTVPNSSLRKEDGSYAPAHLLADSRMERAGRIDKPIRQQSDLSTLSHTAIIVIIGDEILSAKVEDVNTSFLCRCLREIGWRVSKVVMVPDEVGAIAVEVRSACEAADIVITSGGVGPTLDDVTMAGIAEALERPLARDPALELRIRQHFGDHVTKAHLKMAEAPAGECELIEYLLEDGRSSPFPLVRCRNVFVLPGVPSLLQQKWKAVRAQLEAEAGAVQPYHSVVLRLALADETAVAPALDSVAAQLADQVTLGSYPVSGQPDGARILLSLESKDRAHLRAAHALLMEALPQQAAVLRQDWDAATLSRVKSVPVLPPL